MAEPSWTRVRELFEAVLDQEPAARRAFLAEQCGDDVDLRRRVEELLAADETPSPGLAIEKEVPAELAGRENDGSLIGQRIGAYEIKRLLGTGGMSTVFAAEQEHPRRTVALKTMRLGLLSDEARRRFRYESEVLGRLRHPAIAQVYEAGTWREPVSGLEVPFFAMEFVEGAMPLTRYVKEKGLDLEAALELFLQVADAVHHGHQLGFIHRDLKPANVLVDSRGQPKVIDFGIARATDPDRQGATLQTRSGQVLGTLQYMAPEQVDAPGEVDIRVDVYALGVMLYELLAGRPPHEPGEQSITAFAAHVRQHEAPLPSSSPAGFLLGGLARDLDWITRKAIAADKTERYVSVSELAADIRRFLDHQPVSVGPPSTTYYLRKFVRRNKALVGGVAGVFLALILGVVGTSWQMVRATDAAEEAHRQANKAQRINDFLNEILRFGTPSEGRYRSRPDMTIREALDMAAARLEKLEEDPAVEADVRVRLAEAFLDTGQPEKAKTHYARALELRRKSLGGEHPDVAECVQGLGLVESRLGNKRAALALHREALVIFQQAHGQNHRDVAIARLNIGSMLWSLGRFDEGETELTRAIEMCRRLPEDLERFVALGLRQRAMLLQKKGDKRGAIQMYRQALDSFERAGKTWHPSAARARESLAMLLRKQKDYAEAEVLMRDALHYLLESYGEGSKDAMRAHWHMGLLAKNMRKIAAAESHLRLAEAVVDKHSAKGSYFPTEVRAELAFVLRLLQKDREALPFSQKALEGALKARGDAALTYPLTRNHGRILRDVGRLEEAEALFRRQIKHMQDVGFREADILMARNDLGMVLERQDKLDEARPILEDLVTRAPKVLPGGHWALGIFQRSYGMCLVKQGQFEDAETQLRQALAILEKSQGKNSLPVRRTLEAQSRLYAAWEKPTERKKVEARLAGR